MSRALRTGFLVSGLLHVAVVAAITLSPRPEAAAVAEDAPITLRLAMFEPPAPVPVVQEVPQPRPVEPPPEPVPPEPVVAEPPPPEPMIPEPPPEDEPEPAPAPEPEPPPPPSPVARPPKPRPPVTARRPAPPRPAPVPRPAAPSPPAAAPVIARSEAPRPAAPPVDPDARQHYLAALAARINRNKFYPRTSRRLGEEGTVVVSFVIQRSGELTDLAIVESSGHPRLDEAALETLRRASPFREIPDTVAREQWPIRVPIAFGLRD